MNAIDLSAPRQPLRDHLRMRDVSGRPDAITVTSKFLEKGGQPWFPVMGEFHFSRYAPEQWKRELAKMKSGGITVVATYLFWQHHEEIQRRFRWDDSKDIRRFVELCAELGLDVVARIGPWSHGEARNGGFPDWVQSADLHHRTNDERYLQLVRPYYAQIAEQLSGLFYVDGGPIVAIQVENELYDQPEHLTTLKHLAQELGMSAPLWTATGWGKADLPADELLPLYAGYAEAAWEDAHPGWARGSRRHFFFTELRDDHTIGGDLRSTEPSGSGPNIERYPYATCELGGGMQASYHRRPIVTADDVAALAMTKLGSGSAWQGYYLYHGCSQLIGELSTTQESLATGYPNDMPVISYDYQAPLGESGQLRPSYHKLRLQHLFLETVGTELAAMPVALPHQTPSTLDDTETVRWSVRSDGHSGFLFVNNYQPSTDAMPPHANVQFTVNTANGSVITVPSQPVTIPGNSYFVWPLNYSVTPGLVLESATAQLAAAVDGDGTRYVVFAKTAGIPTEFTFAADLDLPESDSYAVDRRGSKTLVTVNSTAPVSSFRPGSGVEIVVLDQDTALKLWKGTLNGKPTLVIADTCVLGDDTVEVQLPAGEVASIRFLPAVEHLAAGDSIDARQVADFGPFRAFELQGSGSAISSPTVAVTSPAKSTVPVRTGGPYDRAVAPLDQDFDAAAKYRLTFTENEFPDGGQTLLRIDWVGDSGRAVIDGNLIADSFWNGLEWEIDLTSHRAAVLAHGLELQLFPFNPDAAVYVEESIRPSREELLVKDITLNHIQHATATVS